MPRRDRFLQTDFSRGEISPKFDGRVDIDAYRQGVSYLRNFISMRQGGITKTPGTTYLNRAINDAHRAHLMPFVMAPGAKYVLEFGNLSLSVYKGGFRVHTGVTTPYASADLVKLQAVKIRDDIYLACEGYKVQKLSWDGSDTGWSMADLDFQYAEGTPITGITKDDPAVVSSASHGLLNGQRVYLSGVGGMIEVNNKYFTVAGATTNTFELEGIDSMDYTTYTSGGTAQHAGADLVGEPERYPRGIAFMEQRLILFGSSMMPSTVWGSAVGEYTNFLIGANDAEAWQFTIASGDNEDLLWAQGKQVLFFGSRQGEHILTGHGGGITPTSVYTAKQTPYGSEEVSGILVDDAVIFVQSGGRIVREYFYQNEQQSYRSPEITFFSDQVFDSGGVIQTALQRNPETIVWFVTSDGRLVGVTYDRNFEIVGFHQHTTDGQYESVAVINDGKEDRVYCSVRRYINDAWVRHIELFDTREVTEEKLAVYSHSATIVDHGGALDIEGITQANPAVVTSTSHGLSNGERVFIDGVGGMTEVNRVVYAVANAGANTFQLRDETDQADIDSIEFGEYTSGGTLTKVQRTITGLGYLEGKDVVVLADGSPVPPIEVFNGEIELESYHNKIVLGLPYSSQCRLMRIGAGELKRVHRLFVRFLGTIGARIGPDSERMRDIVWRQPGENIFDPPQPFSGDKEENFPGNYDRDGYVWIDSDTPTPITVLSVTAEMAVYEGV